MKRILQDADEGEWWY